MIYPHYSSWNIGDDVQNDAKKDKVDLTLVATAPFSSDGIRMKDLQIIKDGKLTAIHGSTPFCRYLGLKPTGNFSKTRCDNQGSESFEDMKRNLVSLRLRSPISKRMQCQDISAAK